MNQNFNREQQNVIEATGGYHLVLAPPGCGKTAVLAERVVWAHEHGVRFGDMACLTFTNRAARGMKERIMERLPEAQDLDQLFVGNVHRFCSRFLFDNAIVPEHTTIIDTDTSFSIMADFLGEDELKVLGDNKERQRYSQILNLQHLMYQCEHRYPSRLMVHRDALTSSALKELCTAFRLPYTQDTCISLYRMADHYLSEKALLSREATYLLICLDAARQYERYKQQNDLLDFEDILLRTYDTLTDTASADVVPRQLGWIQVDEVQDLNPLQLAIIDRIQTPDATVVYLGDTQQAIFSFMGAQTDTLSLLRQRAGEEHFHNFFVNYRSPRYLLDVFNQYGEQQLGIARELLPSTQNVAPCQPGDLMLMEAETSVDEVNMVACEVKRIFDTCPDETVAVVVAFNSDADEVSAALQGIPHFKVSGADCFSTPEVRLLLAHLSVASMEQNFIAWSHLFTGLRVYSSNSASRQFVRHLMELAISPVDFIDYDGSTYLAEFVRAYEQQDIVVFDTETTGLSVFDDDVVQIAAVKVRQGRVVDELNLFIETSRPIPPMLGDLPNPLIDEYARQPHLPAAEALRRFVDFAKGCAILGHNATYDYQIMEHNMQRYAPDLSMARLWPAYFDSLKLARLLHPRQPSYKLKDLLVQLELEGQNSHLANDDIMATRSLMVYCYDRSRSIVGRQREFVRSHQKVIERFRHLYADLYRHTRQRLYVQADEPLLSLELQFAYDYLRRIGRVEVLPKLHYIIRYIDHELLSPASGRSLAEQLSRHMQDLTTMKEADLCGSASMTERIFISTVHKAKGLEFDHVIVFDAVDGKYPSAFAATSGSAQQEEARKFYVAISRARRRLVIAYCHNSVSRWGRVYPKQLTPYMASIREFFT
ncbi:MAG: UvrD-helicase domain-containing protein [Prevotella sp.]|nr:UvrD-helicase domain-containing protein [Prevotella sp.]